MRFSFLAALALIGAAAAQNTIASGQPCKKDGSMGICQSGLCIQEPNQAQGVCK
ncbi:hypothetical protein C8Q69DRAFT_449391 [Paecilomyces variotii]|uniref:Uncharacterized protein n=1 Tax=Byssochlamys spectabilis TaxID=264951 RepID=A0A443I4J1_BYSSP|nr:hypothetical protein C8Q69DRAFT_449391 [Paecilomyces variotii]RWQ98984.1 hypothetical protein C8Q69DRAFT_449391 [Paecilomyces variotii]